MVERMAVEFALAMQVQQMQSKNLFVCIVSSDVSFALGEFGPDHQCQWLDQNHFVEVVPQAVVPDLDQQRSPSSLDPLEHLGS